MMLELDAELENKLKTISFVVCNNGRDPISYDSVWKFLWCISMRSVVVAKELFFSHEFSNLAKGSLWNYYRHINMVFKFQFIRGLVYDYSLYMYVFSSVKKTVLPCYFSDQILLIVTCYVLLGRCALNYYC